MEMFGGPLEDQVRKMHTRHWRKLDFTKTTKKSKKTDKSALATLRECWSTLLVLLYADLQLAVTRPIGKAARGKAFSDAATLLASGTAAGGC